MGDERLLTYERATTRQTAVTPPLPGRAARTLPDAVTTFVGREREAAMLFGAAEAFHGRYGYRFDNETLDRQRALGLPEPWARGNDRFGVWQGLRDALVTRDGPVPTRITDVDAADAEWWSARQLPAEVAVARALAIRAGEPETSSRARTGLSARELDVLRLLVEGASDAEIASALFISRRTVATHVRHIYDKLGVSSRAAAAAAAVRGGLA